MKLNKNLSLLKNIESKQNNANKMVFCSVNNMGNRMKYGGVSDAKRQGGRFLLHINIDSKSHTISQPSTVLYNIATVHSRLDWLDAYCLRASLAVTQNYYLHSECNNLFYISIKNKAYKFQTKLHLRWF